MDGTASPFLAACRGEPHDRVPGVVHAPGRAVAARVPSAPRRGVDPRRHPRPRARRRDHPATGPPLRRRRRHPLQRHRRASRRRSASASTSRPAPARSSSGRSRPPPTSTDSGRSSPRPTRPTCSRPCASSPASCPCRSSPSPARRSRWPATSIEGRPSRTYAKTKALMLGDPVLFGAAARPAGAPRRRLDRLAGRRRRPRLPALRLVGRRPHAGAVRDARPAPLAHGVRAPAPSSACRASTSA